MQSDEYEEICTKFHSFVAVNKSKTDFYFENFFVFFSHKLWFLSICQDIIAFLCMMCSWFHFLSRGNQNNFFLINLFCMYCTNNSLSGCTSWFNPQEENDQVSLNYVMIIQFTGEIINPQYQKSRHFSHALVLNHANCRKTKPMWN